MSHLPEEIVADILSRLPVKPLLRFRCVSKPWRALIDSSDFIKSHLKRSTETRTNRSIILGNRYDDSSDYTSEDDSSNYKLYLYSVDVSSLDVAVEIDYPLLNRKECCITDIVGSCDGLLLLYGGKQIVLLNPFTRKHQILPSHISTKCYEEIHGLGYDSISDDYKVMRTVYRPIDGEEFMFNSEVQVYSLKSNQWRRVLHFPHGRNYRESNGVFAAGALHWIVNRSRSENDADYVVTAFDLATEEYRLVPLPDPHCQFSMKLGVLEGCLYFSRYDEFLTCDYPTSVEVWIMKEYGVSESWTKLYEVLDPGMTPLAYSTNGNEVILLEDNYKLSLLDLDHSLVKELKVRGLGFDIDAQVCCVQSLVPLRNSERHGRKKRHREKKKNFKQGSSGKGSTPGQCSNSKSRRLNKV